MPDKITTNTITLDDIQKLSERVNGMIVDITGYEHSYPNVWIFRDGSGRIVCNKPMSADRPTLINFSLTHVTSIYTLGEILAGKHDDELRQRIRDIFTVREADNAS